MFLNVFTHRIQFWNHVHVQSRDLLYQHPELTGTLYWDIELGQANVVVEVSLFQDTCQCCTVVTWKSHLTYLLISSATLNPRW